MRFFQAVTIERFMAFLINTDRDLIRLSSSFELEKEELIDLLAEHCRDMGIYMVESLAQAKVLKEHTASAMLYSPLILNRRAAIRQRLEKAREKNRRG